MSGFTDAQLERLKIQMSAYKDDQRIADVSVWKINALLHRLGCAEKVCDEMAAMLLPPHSYSIEPLKVWLKSKGDAGR